MGRTVWSIRLAAVVESPPEFVMAWWFHPDRGDEAQRRITGGDVTDFVLTESTADGVRVRNTSFKDRRGWDHHHRTERHLAPDGSAARSGDRYIVPGSDLNEMRSSRGQRITLQCEARLEFIARTDGATEVCVQHSHTLAGGSWVTRLAIRRSDPAKEEQQFNEMIAECKAALSPE